MDEFTLALEVHIAEEMEAPEFQDIPFSDAHMDTAACWTEISTNPAPYTSSNSKASHLRSRAMRYLHKVMAHHISGRRPIHIGHTILHYIMSQATHPTMRLMISTGPFITQLVKGLGIFDDIPLMTEYGRWDAMGLATLTHMRMIRLDPILQAYRFITLGQEVGQDAPAHDDQPTPLASQLPSSSSMHTWEEMWQQQMEIIATQQQHS